MPERRKYSREVDDEALHDGVPEWLISSVVAWLDDVVEDFDELERAWHRKFRQRLVAIDMGEYDTRDEVLESVIQQDRLLDLVQVVLERITWDSGLDEARVERFVTTLVGDLASALKEGGSKWQVAWDADGVVLCERVPSASTDAFAATVDSASEAAAGHLAKAWRELYTRGGDATEAYEQSVKAVEAACIGKTIPNDPKPTLGKAISHMKSTSGAWRARPSSSTDSEGAVLSMMESLWTGQEARHARPSAVVEANREDADVAVHLAIALVRIWETDAIARRDG